MPEDRWVSFDNELATQDTSSLLIYSTGSALGEVEKTGRHFSTGC
jgi:hypothetical protein